MPSQQMWTIIQRYLSNDCTTGECRKVEQWMNKNPDNAKLVRELEEILKRAPKEKFEVNIDDAWKRFRKHQIKQPALQKKEYRSSRKTGWKTILFRAAAVFLVVAFVGFFAWQFRTSDHQPSNESTVAMRKVTTQRGITKKIIFSDGTTVVLNASSSLQFPEEFKNAKREVYLQGEAYFSVAPNKSRPFIVHTSNAVVKVLGTEFDVQAWKGSGQTAVGVREGKVALIATDSLTQQSSRTFLISGQAATVKGKHISDIRTINVANMALWRNGGLHFDSTPFAKVVKRIERQFDINVRISNSNLKEVPFTGTFKHAGLEEVLNIISMSMGIDYVREDSVVVFNQ